eukprot:m.118056 g.118056  ORF g.118056 m.118056 type:complete len:762 (-) comp17197_c0_seq3:176-2461(-)
MQEETWSPRWVADPPGTSAVEDIPDTQKGTDLDEAVRHGIDRMLRTVKSPGDGAATADGGSQDTTQDTAGPLKSMDTAPTMQAMVDLFAAVGHECIQNSSSSNMFCSVFAQRYGVAINRLQSRQRWTIADFTIVRKISEGNYADIFLASYENRPVAIKKMPKTRVVQQPRSVCFVAEREFLVLATEAREKLRRQTPTSALPEVGSKSTLPTRTGLRALLGLRVAFQDDDSLYLVTEYYPGGDLCGLCDKFEAFSEDMTRFYIAETVLALEAMHTLGYVHRDVRPDNIFVNARGHVTLGDFGSCAALHPTTRTVAAEEQFLAFHAPEYIAPELMTTMHGVPCAYGPECDWWSLGVVMYELMHGQGPFEAPTVLDTHRKVMAHSEHLVFSDDVTVSADAKDLIRRLVCDKGNRLGINGAAEVKAHPFFRGICWDDLRDKKAPWIPELSSLFDTSLFEEYGDSDSPTEMEKPVRTSYSTSGGLSERLAKALPFVGYDFIADRCKTSGSGVGGPETPRLTPRHRLLRRRSSGPLETRLKRASQDRSSILFVEAELPVLSPDVTSGTAVAGGTPSRVASSPGASRQGHSPTKSSPVLSRAVKLSPRRRALLGLASEDATMSSAPAQSQKPKRRVGFHNDVIYLDAAKSGDLHALCPLIENGDIGIEHAGPTGMTALSMSANFGHVDIVRYLLDQSANINAACLDGCTALHLAVLEEKKAVVELLLARGADVNIKNSEGETPLTWAQDSEEMATLFAGASQESESAI